MSKLDEKILRKRWEIMRGKVQKSVDSMDINHWTYLNNAIDQVETLMCLPNDNISYRKAFLRLEKEVLDDYVQSENPEEDIFEETYHLLQYFKKERYEVESFKEYLAVKRLVWNEKKSGERKWLWL